MKPHDPYRPDLPPPSFILPFGPPGSQSPYIPEGSSTDDDSDDESTTDSSSDDLGPRPDWWPEDWPWPLEPEEPVVIEAPPPIHIWPRLPPDHPTRSRSATKPRTTSHPGEYYPDMPPYPVVHPVQPDEDSSNDGGST